jgi:type IV secretory pathway TrbD component
MTINKAMLDSYLRNLVGVALALVTTTMANAGVASPLDFGLGEWLTVLNGVWAAAVPTLIRWLNSKDPAFGRVAEGVAAEVSKKLAAEAKAAAAAKKKAETAAAKAAAKASAPATKKAASPKK